MRSAAPAAAQGTRFAAMPSLPVLGSTLAWVVLRTAMVYRFVVVAPRLSGKRDVGTT
jgi:hypothetical protein